MHVNMSMPCTPEAASIENFARVLAKLSKAAIVHSSAWAKGAVKSTAAAAAAATWGAMATRRSVGCVGGLNIRIRKDDLSLRREALDPLLRRDSQDPSMNVRAGV